jgi:hypothetical protein
MSVSVRPRRRSIGGLVPLLGLLWLVYNAIVLVGASSVLERVVSSFTLPSGAVWTMRGGEVLVALGLVALYVEMLKATRTGTSSVIEHSLSVLVFVLFLVEFIIVPGAGTATFLLMTLMALLDVIAGFSISIFAARRDFAIDRTVE